MLIHKNGTIKSVAFQYFDHGKTQSCTNLWETNLKVEKHEIQPPINNKQINIESFNLQQWPEHDLLSFTLLLDMANLTLLVSMSTSFVRLWVPMF